MRLLLLILALLTPAQTPAAATWHAPHLDVTWPGFACVFVDDEPTPRVCGTAGYQTEYGDALALVGRRVRVVSDSSAILLDTIISPPEPWLTAGWSDGVLDVAWIAPEPVCLFVAGRLYPVVCAASGSTVISRAGDAAYVAVIGRTIELRTAWGFTPVAQTVIPPAYRLTLPLVAVEGR